MNVFNHLYRALQIVLLLTAINLIGCRNAPEPDVRIHCDGFGRIVNEGDTITIWDHSFANVVEISVATLIPDYNQQNKPYYIQSTIPYLKISDDNYLGSRFFLDSINKNYFIKIMYSDVGRTRFDYDTSRRPTIRYVLDDYRHKSGKYIICTKAYNVYTDYGLGFIPLAERQRKTAERVDTIYIK